MIRIYSNLPWPETAVNRDRITPGGLPGAERDGGGNRATRRGGHSVTGCTSRLPACVGRVDFAGVSAYWRRVSPSDSCGGPFCGGRFQGFPRLRAGAFVLTAGCGRPRCGSFFPASSIVTTSGNGGSAAASGRPEDISQRETVGVGRHPGRRPNSTSPCRKGSPALLKVAGDNGAVRTTAVAEAASGGSQGGDVLRRALRFPEAIAT